MQPALPVLSHNPNLTTLSIGCIKRNQKDDQCAKACREEPSGAIKENKSLPDHPHLQTNAQGRTGTARLEVNAHCQRHGRVADVRASLQRLVYGTQVNGGSSKQSVFGCRQLQHVCLHPNSSRKPHCTIELCALLAALAGPQDKELCTARPSGQRSRG